MKIELIARISGPMTSDGAGGIVEIDEFLRHCFAQHLPVNEFRMSEAMRIEFTRLIFVGTPAPSYLAPDGPWLNIRGWWRNTRVTRYHDKWRSEDIQIVIEPEQLNDYFWWCNLGDAVELTE